MSLHQQNQIPLRFILIFLSCTLVSTERVVIQGSKNCDTDCFGSKLDSILEKLSQLEHKVGGCVDPSKFDLEDFINRSTSTSNNAAKCDLDAARYCKKIGVSDVTVPDAKSTFKVLCDKDNWIIILQRFDGSVSFHNKNWDAYKNGFGTIGGRSEFFLGLQYLHDITHRGFFELRIELEDFEGQKRIARYNDFSVGDELSNYRLGYLGVYSGDAGDSFKYHEGQSFTTLDRDNDAKAIGSCGEEFNSAGWFKECMRANLMGNYLQGENTNFKEGMYWDTFKGPDYSLKSVKMSIRSKC